MRGAHKSPAHLGSGKCHCLQPKGTRTWAKLNPAWRGPQLWGRGPVAQSRAVPSSAGRRLRLQHWPVTNMSTAPHTSRVPPTGTIPCHAHSGPCRNTITTCRVWRNTSDPGRGSTSGPCRGRPSDSAKESPGDGVPDGPGALMRGPDAAGRGAALRAMGPGQQPLDVSGSESRIWGWRHCGAFWRATCGLVHGGQLSWRPRRGNVRHPEAGHSPSTCWAMWGWARGPDSHPQPPT